jgi:hypothetical protein
MSTMQEFYTQLFQAPETDSPDWAALAQLTQATVAEMSALKKMTDWCEWHHETA